MSSKREIRAESHHVDDILSLIDSALTEYDYVANVTWRIDNGRPAFTNVIAVA